MVRAVAIDVGPLRASRDFRLLWIGEVVSVTGQQVTAVALLIQIFALTHSTLAVGAIGAVEFFPLLLGGLVGGPLIDRTDKRLLLLVTQFSLAATSGVLLYGALIHHPPLWLLYIAAGISSGLSGIDAPTRTATVPTLIDRETLPAAISLNFVMWNIAVIAGPALGGIVVGSAGVAWAYGIDLATYAVAVVLVLRMRRVPPAPTAEAPGPWRSLKEGFGYLRGRSVLQSTFSIDLFAMVFGLPEALFPVLALHQFRRGPGAVGYLFSAAAIGALLASLFNGWIGRVRHQGRAVIWAVVVWGAAVTAFGLTGHRFYLALVLLAVAGGADAISAVFRSTILQSTVPDELRGRLSSIHFLVVAGGPKLGYLESGAVADLITPAFAVVSGGLACVVGAALVAILVPEFRRYHSGEDT